MEIRSFTVGPVAENCFLVRKEGSKQALIIDPGDEADRLLAPVRELELEVEAILLTHCHFDHVGAVAPVARETGAPVYCPEIELPILADIQSYTWPGAGPYEPYEAEHSVSGGETLELAGFRIEVLFTPGHSPGHVTYVFESENALLSGDVLFQGSVGRVDLPGGDGPTLMSSLKSLADRFPDETDVLPGHGPVTTMGRERASNPFLAELSRPGSGG